MSGQLDCVDYDLCTESHLLCALAAGKSEPHLCPRHFRQEYVFRAEGMGSGDGLHPKRHCFFLFYFFLLDPSFFLYFSYAVGFHFHKLTQRNQV